MANEYQHQNKRCGWMLDTETVAVRQKRGAEDARQAHHYVMNDNNTTWHCGVVIGNMVQTAATSGIWYLRAKRETDRH